MTNTQAASPALRRNAIANVIGRIGSVAVGVLVTPFALRHLGPERFGIYSLFFILSGYVVTVDFGMWAGVARFVAMASVRGERSGVERALRRGLSLSVALAVLWSALLILGREVFLRVFHVPTVFAVEVRAALAVFAISLVLQAVSLVLQGALTGLKRLDLWNAYFMAGLIANTAVLVVLLSRGMGLMAVSLAALAGHTVSSTLAAITLRVLVPKIGPRGPDQGVSWRELTGYGFAVQFSNALGMAQFHWAWRTMIGVLGRLVWLTEFELGFRVANALWSLPTLAQLSVVPAAADASASGGEERAREVYRWCCRWVFAATAWALGALWLLAPPLFRLWLGPGHDASVETARWLAIAFAISTLAGPATAVSRGFGWPILEGINFAIALAINVGLGIVLIPRLGAPGAAISMAVSFVFAGAWMLTVFHRRLGVATASWAARLVLPRYVASVAIAVAMGVVLNRLRWESAASAVLGIFVGGLSFTALYVAATWRTGDPATLWRTGRSWLERLSRRPASASAGPES